MNWEDLFRALALVLVIEGMWPFLAPSRWRQVLARIVSMDDRSLRITGLVSMALGLIVLQVLR